MYEFKGAWEDKIVLPYLSEFRNASGSYASLVNKKNHGLVDLNIIDEWTADPDPKPSQIAAINYLLENQIDILDALLQHVYDEYDNIKAIYNYEEPDKSEWTPDVQSPGDFKNLIGIGVIHIHVEEIDGIANIGFECGCTWDDEHGLGIVLNKDKLINIGQGDDAFRSDPKPEGYIHPEIPIKYQPHPKYNTLKPFQILQNRSYEVYLIQKKLNKDFINHLNNDEIDLEKKGKTLLEVSLRMKNFEITKELIKQGIDINICIPDFFIGSYDKDQLNFILKNGGDINSCDQNGKTAIIHKCYNLANEYASRHHCEKFQIDRVPQVNQHIQRVKSEILELYKLGAKLDIKYSYGYDIYCTSSQLKPKEKNEMDNFLNNIKTKKLKWKFW